MKDSTVQRKGSVRICTECARGCRALNVGSVIAGTQSNAGKGVISGTSQGTGDCVILTGSPTVTIEGKPVAYHGSVVGINNHNCLGKLYTKIIMKGLLK